MEQHRREPGGRGGGGEEENGARDHELQRSSKRRDVDAGGAVEKVKPEQECERNAGNEAAFPLAGDRRGGRARDPGET